MFKLGEYCEEDAKSIVKYLKNAGMKVELKTSIESSMDTEYYLQGRLSELKEEEFKLDDYERYLDVARSLLARGVKPEEFEDQFVLEIDPSMEEKRSQLADMLEESQGESEKGPDGKDEEEKQEKFISLIQEISKASRAVDFVDDAFRRNDIKFGEEASGQMEDPILRIPVSSKDFNPEHNLCKSTLSVYLEKLYEVYIDEFSSALDEEIGEDFQDSFPDEYLKIMAMGILVRDLVEEPGKGKMEFDDFVDRCMLQLDNNGNIMKIDGSDVVEDIAKVLEKNGVIKIKGDIIKWKA